MKKKYLKKILAVMLASMTVSATPGLVGAMSKETRKAIEEANSKIENHTLTEADETDMLNKFEEMAKEDDEAKAKIAEIMTKMPYHRLSPPSDKTISQIINIFKQCSNCDAAKENVAKAIHDILIEETSDNSGPFDFDDELNPIPPKPIKHFNQLSNDNVSEIMQLFKKVVKGSEPIVADLISSLIEACVVEPKSIKYHLDIDEILTILNCSIENEEAREYAAEAINMALLINEKIESSFMGNFDINSKRKTILKILQKCSGSDCARDYVSRALSNYKSLWDKDSVNQCLSILDNCSNGEFDKRNVSCAICYCYLDDPNLPNKDSCGKVLNMLRKSSHIYNGIPIQAIEEMIEKGLLNKETINENMSYIDDILHIIKSYPTERHNIYAIERMADKGLLEPCQNDKIAQIVNSVFFGAKANHLAIVRSEICQFIKTMAEKDILRRCPKPQIDKLVMGLTEIFDEYGTPKVIEAISAINEKGLISEVDPNHLEKLIDSLINKFNIDRTAISTTLAAIFRNNNVMDKIYIYPGQPQTLVNILANDNTRDAATVIISAMAENPAIFNRFNNAQHQQILHLFKTQLNNYLENGNYEMVDRIFVVLGRCSEINDLKADVADIAEMLVNRDDFYTYLNADITAGRLGNFLDISTSCSDTQNTTAQSSAMQAMAYLFQQFRRSIEQTEIINAIVRDKLPTITESLERSSNSDLAKNKVSNIITLLANKGLLPNPGQNQDQGQVQINGRHVVNAINNCLTYGNTRISAMQHFTEGQEYTAISVRSIFENPEWVALFKATLSPEDRERLDALAIESYAAIDEVYKTL